MAASRDEGLAEFRPDDTARVARGFFFGLSLSVGFWLLIGVAAWAL
jgi:hypothetical protein